MRSLYRDAVNVLIGRILRRSVLVFWRGWENTYRGTEFPRGNHAPDLSPLQNGRRPNCPFGKI